MTDPYATHLESSAVLVADTRTPAEKKLDTMLRDEYDMEMGHESARALYKIATKLIEEADAERVKVQRQVKDACKPYGKAGECVYNTFMAKQKGKA